MLDYNTYDKKGTVFKVIGVGGCGCNAVNNMIEYGVKGCPICCFLAKN